jgi:hypothetical protein
MGCVRVVRSLLLLLLLPQTLWRRVMSRSGWWSGWCRSWFGAGIWIWL